MWVAAEHASPRAGRTVKDAVRYVVGVAVGAVVLVLLFGKRGELAASWRQLGQVKAGWVACAVTAEAASLWTFAYLQHKVLRLSGARIAVPSLFLLSLANDAIAITVPGEPAVSSAYRFQYYRRHGASGASAGWTIFTILIAQAIAMSVLLLVGVIVALAASTSLIGAGVMILGLVVVIGAGAVLVRRDLVLRLAGAMVRAVRLVTGRPRGRVGARIESTFARMSEIPLSPTSTAEVVGIALGIWCCDFLCLVCSFRAVGGTIPWGGVLVAYGAAQVVGSLPIVPGGLGIVEGSLAVILVAYGADRVSALAATIAFRLVNFWLAIAVGWLAVAVIAHQRRRLERRAHPTAEPAMDVVAPPPSEASTQSTQS